MPVAALLAVMFRRFSLNVTPGSKCPWIGRLKNLPWVKWSPLNRWFESHFCGKTQAEKVRPPQEYMSAKTDKSVQKNEKLRKQENGKMFEKGREGCVLGYCVRKYLSVLFIYLFTCSETMDVNPMPLFVIRRQVPDEIKMMPYAMKYFMYCIYPIFSFFFQMDFL